VYFPSSLGNPLTVQDRCRPPKQVSDIDNKLFKEEVNGLGIKRKKDILIIGGDFNLPDICWSELQRCLNDGCVVKNKSSVFSFLVGKSTNCSRPLSAMVSRYA
jgi:hypothetical protein